MGKKISSSVATYKIRKETFQGDFRFLSFPFLRSAIVDPACPSECKKCRIDLSQSVFDRFNRIVIFLRNGMSSEQKDAVRNGFEPEGWNNPKELSTFNPQTISKDIIEANSLLCRMINCFWHTFSCFCFIFFVCRRSHPPTPHLSNSSECFVLRHSSDEGTNRSVISLSCISLLFFFFCSIYDARLMRRQGVSVNGGKRKTYR